MPWSPTGCGAAQRGGRSAPTACGKVLAAPARGFSAPCFAGRRARASRCRLPRAIAQRVAARRRRSRTRKTSRQRGWVSVSACPPAPARAGPVADVLHVSPPRARAGAGRNGPAEATGWGGRGRAGFEEWALRGRVRSRWGSAVALDTGTAGQSPRQPPLSTFCCPGAGRLDRRQAGPGAAARAAPLTLVWLQRPRCVAKPSAELYGTRYGPGPSCELYRKDGIQGCTRAPRWTRGIFSILADWLLVLHCILGPQRFRALRVRCVRSGSPDSLRRIVRQVRTMAASSPFGTQKIAVLNHAWLPEMVCSCHQGARESPTGRDVSRAGRDLSGAKVRDVLRTRRVHTNEFNPWGGVGWSWGVGPRGFGRRGVERTVGPGRAANGLAGPGRAGPD
jgi:hypothetical protein